MIEDVARGDGDGSDDFSAMRLQIETETGGGYLTFRRLLSPRYAVVWRDLLLGWAAVVGIAGSLVVAQDHLATGWGWLVLPAASLALGLAFHFIGLFLHEAAHNGLASSRARNDALADVFVGPLVLTDIRTYRPVHLDHHRFLGTDRDPERTYRSRLSMRFILSTVSGVHTLRVMRLRGSLEAPGRNQPRHILVPAAGALAHTAVIVGSLAAGSWWLAGAWLLAIFSWFPCFGALRQLLEHRPPAALRQETPEGCYGAYTREFSGHRLNAIFGGAGFNRHLIHHWEPGVSYTRLAELERLLEGTSADTVIARRRATYFGTARILVRTGG